MQFKYPEFLYALLLLLIPIFIHLFQLRRFEKVSFSNVDFLKKVELQTRKSAKLKKFLILLSRLGLFAALIIAFAQPYFSKNKQQLQPKTVLYLDNSFSMQAKNGTTSLFKSTIQNIIANYNDVSELTIITNDDIYKKLSEKDLKNQLLSLDYSPLKKDLNTVILQANKIVENQKGFKNNLVLVSDFQSNSINGELLLNKEIDYSFVQLKPQENKNISIDSVYIAKQNGQNIDLEVMIKSYHIADENLSVSLFKDDILIGKTTCDLKKDKSSKVSFQIPFNDTFNGKIVIDDNLIPFDNQLYFSINKLEKINVLAIGNNNEFLSKIYTNSEFNYVSNKLNQVAYNIISNQHLIVLNELETIPLSLQKALNDFVKNGGSIVVIPSSKTNITNYNQLFTSLHVGAISEINTTEHQVNTINFSHPILDNVFEKKIRNFQYPHVKSSYDAVFKNKSAILQFENQKAFISQVNSGNGKMFWLASPINQINSNFKSSPLIVPVFYNVAKQSYQITNLYYIIGEKNQLAIKTTLNKDEVLTVESNANAKKNKFIPLQQIYQQKVVLQMEDNPLKEGFYQVNKEKATLKKIAFNYDRMESATDYNDIKSLINMSDNVSFSNDLTQAFSKIESTYKVKSYWQYFIALAIMFLIIELLLIKFLKH